MNKDELVKNAFMQKSDESVYQLFKYMYDQEIFIKISDDNQGLIQIVKTDSSHQVVIIYTQANHKNLNGKYAGALWQNGLRVIADIPPCEGVVIINNDNASVAIEKTKLKALLAIYKPQALTAPLPPWQTKNLPAR